MFPRGFLGVMCCLVRVGISFVQKTEVSPAAIRSGVVSVDTLVTTTDAGQNVRGGAAFFAVPAGVVADEAVGSAMRAFVAAGGTSQFPYQTAAARVPRVPRS
jgi:hypothetical protein